MATKKSQSQPPTSPRPKKVTPKPDDLSAPAAVAQPAGSAPPVYARTASTPLVKDTLYTWHGLQEALRVARTVEEAENILEAEKKGPNRLRWLLRIQGRRQVLRGEAETAELMQSAQE